MRWRKVSLIGVGLLGGSLGMALRKLQLAHRVHGYVRRDSTIAEAVQAGAVDAASTDLREVVDRADVIVFCTPLGQMHELAKQVAETISPDCLVTDVGSVKGEIVKQLEPVFDERHAVFVGSHPMAGSEKTGVSAARADLFTGAVCVVTPTDSTPKQHLDATERLWKSVGARTMRLSPERHDELVARSSHLPQALAANLAASVLDTQHGIEQSQLCATGFRDSTRIASGSPEMWRDIALMNRKELGKALHAYQRQLDQFAAVLEKGDPSEIGAFFAKAKQLRDAWLAGCPTPSSE